ncbi:cell wall anchor protein [Algibacter sp. AS12]|uniref:cell wall anchor protein n=1 Tax=Algibacter sp. AS12 TaxID=3135773 RepID=UPI00398AE464
MRFFTFIFIITIQTTASAQVGIGTTDPHESSALDITSDSQGFLAPRMITADRIAISNPAEGLLVFDTEEDAFFYFDSSVWVKLEGSVTRDNYKLVKSEADLADELAAGGGLEYLLDENFLYEINGTITLTAPINLNGAYVIGEDTNEDILLKAGGTLFQGVSGGSIRGLTISVTGGSVFDITGSFAETLIVRDCVIANSASVGTLSSFNLIFFSIVQFVNNADGITYTDINEVLINSSGWDSSNGGVYETFTGDFDVISRQGGFSEVTTALAGMDVSAVTSVTGGASIRNVSFLGGGNYINGTSPYAGYDFTNDWDVNTPGIAVETDGVASGNFYYNGNLTTGFTQSITNGTAVEIQGNGSFEANSLFRFVVGLGDNNRLVYDGSKPREFQINASLSIRVTGAVGNFYAFVIAKNGTIVTESNSIVYIDNDTQIQNVSINANVDLANGEFIEVFTQRLTGSGTDSLIVFSENLSIK